MQKIEEYLSSHADANLSELQVLLRIPSVSADSLHKQDVVAAAQFVAQSLSDAGCTAEIFPTSGHPIVWGEWTKRPGAPTVLVYGHFDVQPADPLDQWHSPPFAAEIRDGKIYARGATDDKGQMFTHIKSVAAWLQTIGELPINVKFLIEGEEEVGSNNLDLFIEQNRERCACDVAVISDTAQYGPDMPAITYGLRGIMACEVTVLGPKQDLHSGVFGGSIANPVNVLTRLLAKIQDDQGRVLIPGFYDDVLELTPEERREFAALPFDEAAYLNGLGVPATAGEAGFSTLERRWARPTFDINGIIGGYTGEGPKTIIPSKATAKITCRLVPNQMAAKLTDRLESFLRENCPVGVQLKFHKWHGCEAVLCDLHSPYMAAARSAITQGFGKPPVMIREGGSIPVVATFKRHLGVDTLLLGWGQNTDNLHSPNEHFSVDAFHRGTLASAWLWQEIANKQ
ncbi:dipeptidase [Planctomicrobium sp. SH527]|uniref:dipeptidase n=1 Tax=Planctomicrobium sp. SH527 TaxID=3448123 RepID=UPI003F5C4B86